MARLLHLFAPCAALLLVMMTSVHAQVPGAAPVAPAPPAMQSLTFRGMTVSGSVRTRSYSWDWFGHPDGDYTYPATLVRVGLSETRQSYDWLAEFALPLVIALPSTAVALPPQGQLGL